MSHQVLVTEAQSLGALGVIRSLGRAGYAVHACSSDSNALGLKSNHVAHATICPKYGAPSFCEWVRGYIREHRIEAIIPSESFLIEMRATIQDFIGLMAVPQNPNLLYECFSKYDTLQKCLGAGAGPGIRAHIPRTFFFQGENPEAQWRAGLRFPAYCKADAVYSRLHPKTSCVLQIADNRRGKEVDEIVSKYDRIIVQEHVNGIGVGVFVLVTKDGVRASFMHKRLHEVPWKGGISSLRQSWFHQAIYDDALARIQYLRWLGVAMLEYRWDPLTDEFHFIELNSRFWGSIHLSIFSGVDFPKLLVDNFFGKMSRQNPKMMKQRKCRMTFPLEINYVWDRIKDNQLPIRSKIWTIIEFIMLSLNPMVKSDLLFPGDRVLYIRELINFFDSSFHSMALKLRKSICA